jgi:hypothetical protein
VSTTRTVGSEEPAPLLDHLFEVVTLAKVVKILLWVLPVCAACASLYYGNDMFLLGMVGACLILLAEICWEAFGTKFCGYLRDWYVYRFPSEEAWQRNFPRETYRSYRNTPTRPATAGEVLVVFGGPVLALILGSMIFSDPIQKEGVWTRSCQTGSACVTSLESGWLIAIPFYHDIGWIALKQSNPFEATATTADNIQVRATIDADMSLVPEETSIKSIAGRYTDAQNGIRAERERLLTNRFREIISGRKLAELQSALVVEYDTGSKVTGEALAAFGIRWNGVLRISDLHPFFGASK